MTSGPIPGDPEKPDDKQRMFDRFSLQDRVAIITGGAGMLGRRHAEAISDMGGVAVVIDRDPQACAEAESELRRRFGRGLALVADLTDEAQVKAVVTQVREQLGRIDILVNNAALSVKGGGALIEQGYFAPFESYPRALFDLALQVNLTGAVLVTQAVGAVMVAQKRGVIINVSSDVALISPDHRIYKGMTTGYGGKPFNTPVAYSMSKAALLAFTRYLATYWAEQGIRVNALCPAGVYDNHEAGFVARLSERIPLGRMANRDEYMGAIVFLASDASSFMTGATLVVDGGRTSW